MKSYSEYLLGEAKVSSPNNEKFVKERKAGASDIATRAKSKGSYSDLTAWHFKAKLPQYDEANKAIKRGESTHYFERKVSDLLRRIHPRSMTQQQFQKVMGELEVWGEILIQLRSGKLY